MMNVMVEVMSMGTESETIRFIGMGWGASSGDIFF